MSMALAVVGGFYRELCRFPQVDEFWGSGGRAAAALADYGLERSLSTAVDKNAERQLSSIAYTFNFETKLTEIPSTLQFRYDHPLSFPMIWPPVQYLSKASIQVEAPCVLQYGMLDAAVRVNADTLVYDPQEPFLPQPATPLRRPLRLAYVLNASEARKLGANQDVLKAASTIAEQLHPQVVVVKQGARGALVLSDRGMEHVPAYEATRVWPIGSGDVFAAVFAACWGVQDRSPLEAADSASRAVAHYVQNRILPIPRAVISGEDILRPLNLKRDANSAEKYDVYLAGPFFNMPQLWLVEEARHALHGLGLKVFSPFHDIGMGAGVAVAPKDIEALKKSRAVLALIDGSDTGTVFEVGYARAVEKPVVAFVQSTPEEPLKMISGTGCDIVDDFATAIYRTAWAALK